jgi:hypothetical protein
MQDGVCVPCGWEMPETRPASGRVLSSSFSNSLLAIVEKGEKGRFALPPARSPFPSASGGLWALGCVGKGVSSTNGVD